MAASAANYQCFVEALAKHGPINEIEAWGLNIFCIAFGMKLATHGRLSSDGEQELLENFYRTTYEIATDAFKPDENGYETFVEWMAQKFKEYDPHAQRYFFQADKNEFDFGGVIVEEPIEPRERRPCLASGFPPGDPAHRKYSKDYQGRAVSHLIHGR